MPPGGRAGGRAFQSFSRDKDAAQQEIKPGTVKRIFRFASSYKWIISLFLFLVVADAVIGIINPLLYRYIIDKGIMVGNEALVVHTAFLVAAIAIVDAGISFIQRGISARIGQDMLLEMRVKVFNHIQKMSLAFFTRTRTGALVSRLNTDVSGISTAFTDILSNIVGNAITTVLTLGAMFILSWQLTLISLVLIPLFIVPARYVGKRLQRLTRESYDLASEMNNTMIERFNVAGAQLAKVFGIPEKEEQVFNNKAGRVRDISVEISLLTRMFFIALGLVASLAIAVTFGWGGILSIRHVLDVGTLVAMITYLTRLYGPLTALSNVQVDVLTAIVSFDRVFEILDLEPMVAEKKDAVIIPGDSASIAFHHVNFHYPTPQEVSLASLESVAVLSTAQERQVLSDVTFTVPAGTMTALVGPSGAGKTTITQLIPRFYDPVAGSVTINGIDLRYISFESIREKIGIVTQEAHMFHDSIRANLLYAKADATDAELTEALRAAHVLTLVESLSNGMDTIIGDRGYRLSGGEKQRIAIARVLLKAPQIVVLDEATAHLDSSSEAAIQEAFEVALAGRTSIVIAHRLSTILKADQILVIENGQVVERGTHAELLAHHTLYAELYKRQFAEK